MCQKSPKVKLKSKSWQIVFYHPQTMVIWVVGNVQNNYTLLGSNNDFRVNPCANTDKTEPIRTVTIEKESSKVPECHLILELPNTLTLQDTFF